MDIVLPIFLYGVIWGLYYFWGYKKGKTKVLMNPGKYSRRTVNFYTKITGLQTIIMSFLTAIGVGILAYILRALLI
jgi:hypothetical protein